MPDRGDLPAPAASCDGGDLDCGSGLLLIIRSAMAPLAPGNVLEVRSRERSVREDLPAWCRMVGHALLGERDGDAGYTHYFVKKRGDDDTLQRDLQQARDYVWQARVRWSGGMQAKVAVRNHGLVVGQPASFDTADAAPSAVELLLAALGSALVTGLQWRLSRGGATVRNLELVVKAKAHNSLVFLGVADDGHPGLQAVDVVLYVDADVEPDRLQATLEETVRRCPVTQSLLRAVPVQTSIRTM